MKPEDILVVYKKSRYTLYREKSNKKIDRLMHEHGLHLQTLQLAKKLLQGATFIYRAQLSEELVKKYKLLITIGGDGTVLDASHFCYNTPILGVNSTYDNERGSEGFYCGATRFDLKEVIDKLLKGKLEIFKLNRLQVSVNGQSIKPFALNDILFADKCPGAMSYYTFDLGTKEFQKTSGVWFATAAGSTGAIRSAGGKVMPISSNEIQYVVREPFDGRLKIHNHRSGFSDNARIISEMRQARLFIDGGYNYVKVGFRDIISISNSEYPLNIYNLDLEARKKHYGDK